MEFVRDHADRRQPAAEGGLRRGVEPICQVLTEHFGKHSLKIAPSTYYEHVRRQLTRREQRDEVLKVQIARVHEENFGVYGARKVRLQLNPELAAGTVPALDGAGIEYVARCTVERLMCDLGLSGAVRGKVKKTTMADPAGHRAEDLVQRQFAPAAPDRLWVMDMTHVSTWFGWVYVAFVTDAYARRIRGWRCGTSMHTQLVLDALEQATWTRQLGAGAGDGTLDSVVAHSDRGRQYTAVKYGERLAEAGIAASVGSVGDSLDNALAETINGLYKTVLIKPRGP